ncbi:aminopeptidase P family protein [Flexivirga caeni]|uniref:Xaa-Pro aminopeptidase n=1 Tax=Flexivirga caeni TaxID=2294115 RepID=A0A3M9M0C3_9MICO|nr:aminopeptidase P family protein [Flexivirga caeni]RNI19001.1 aminopeptidase P family protein [Flexivirga caeni]
MTDHETAPADLRMRGLPRLAETPRFLDDIRGGWGREVRRPRLVAGAAAAAAAHRDRLAQALPGRVVVIGSGRSPVRNDDCNYEFRAHSDFLWLLAAPVERAVLVIRTDAGSADATLFMPPPAGPGDLGFFSDANYGELWTGPVPGLAEWSAALGIEVQPIDKLAGSLAAESAVLVGGYVEEGDLGPVRREDGAVLGQTLSGLRMVKDEWEIAQLRAAVDLTVDGFAAVAAEIPAAMRSGGERWLQGTFNRHARTFGNDVGYGTIVATGRNAAVLHWTRCDSALGEQDALLLDMGVEEKSYYTADVTRTIPVSGTFTPHQRMVHDLVEKSHRAGLAAVRPGRTFLDFHHRCMEVIAQGLADWDLLPVSVDEALSRDGQQHRRFIVCGIGHHLGLDVHDCSQSTVSAYQEATLQPGMALTVEPGLYFHANDLTVPPELRGIGVRIEDDLVVTDTGIEVLSEALPITAAGLEEWTRAQLG